MLAVVGRPNVGKSTLVNRLIGRREAVVQDVPGVTRDRVAYDALWNGRRFTSSTPAAGSPTPPGLQAAVAPQAELAMRTADVVLLVVDASVGATDHRGGGRAGAAPLQAAGDARATKVDDERLTSDIAVAVVGSGSASRSR